MPRFVSKTMSVIGSGNSPRISLRMLTQDSFNIRLQFSCHVFFGIFETTATDRDRQTVTPDLCTEFSLVGDCLLNIDRPRFCQIGFGTSTEDLPL